MGFLDFLKDTKKKGTLDVPPMPAYPHPADIEQGTLGATPASSFQNRPAIQLQSQSQAEPRTLEKIPVPVQVEPEFAEALHPDEVLQPTPHPFPRARPIGAKSTDIPDVPDALPSFAEMEKAAESGPRPLFVETQNFRQAFQALSAVKGIAQGFTETIISVNQSNERIESSLERWRANLEDIQRKLVYIDNSLFES
jgi:hypothetical protein